MSDKTRDKLLCQSHESDENIIKEIRKNLLKEEEIKALSNIFKALSDPTRLKIIYILSKSSLCVCDIADLLDMSQSAISHQLRILKGFKIGKI